MSVELTRIGATPQSKAEHNANLNKIEAATGTSTKSVTTFANALVGDHSGYDFVKTAYHHSTELGGAAVYRRSGETGPASTGSESKFYDQSGAEFKLLSSIGGVTANQFGGGHSTNSADALESAAGFAISESCKLLSESALRLERTASIQGCHAEISHAILITDASASIRIGGSSNGLRYPQKLGRVTHNAASAVPAIIIEGTKSQSISIDYALYVLLRVDSEDPENDSIGYSTFNFTSVIKVELDSAGHGWINENTFNLARTRQVVISGAFGHNNNLFFLQGFEGADAYITLNCGHHNVFSGLRGEGVLLGAISCAQGTIGNLFEFVWLDEPKILLSDLGRNSIKSEYISGLSKESIEANYISASITPNSLPPGVNTDDLDLSDGNMSYGGWKYIYDSPAIKVDGPITLINEINNAIEGGVRVEIFAYDSGMNVIADSGGEDVKGQGWSVALATAGPSVNDSTYQKITLDVGAIYIRYRIRAAGNGLKCSGFMSTVLFKL